MKYTITKEIEDKFGRAKVVQYFENLLPDPAVRRNSKLLAKFGGDNVEARRAYDEAVRAIRGKLGNAFEFVDLEKLEDMAP